MVFRLFGDVVGTRRIARLLGVTFVALVGLSNGAFADACFLSPARLSDEAVNVFRNNPEALLTSNPVGGYSLSSQVRSLAGSDTESISSLVRLADNANNAQVTAVAVGLAQAATACVNTRPDISAEIQQAVAESGNQALIAAFAAASGDTQTAAVGGTGGTGAGGGGAIGGDGAGGGGAGGGAGGTNATDSTAENSAFSLSANGSTGSISTTVRTASSTTSVSPTQ